MLCPQCKKAEIGPTGVCPVCGYKLAQTANGEPAQEAEGNANALETQNSHSINQEPAPPGGGLPAWREELSRRLEEIKQKREATAAAGRQAAKIPAHQQSSGLPQIPPVGLIDKPLIRKSPPRPQTAIPRQKPLEPLNRGSFVSKPVSKTGDPHAIRELIDNAVSGKFGAGNDREPVRAAYRPQTALFEKHGGKLILLSRTLSGLVDLVCVVLLTGIFIIASDIFSGIFLLDAVSLTVFSSLFLMTHLVYSIFFLASSNQTIGMMITDLRVVGTGNVRPGARQLLIRWFWHLVSLLMFGIGLLWSLFNRENLCLHDMLSGTRVVRI